MLALFAALLSASTFAMAESRICGSKSESLAALSTAANALQTRFILKMKDSSAGSLNLKHALQFRLGDQSPIKMVALDEQLYSLQVPANEEATDLLASYIQSGEIEFLEPDQEVHVSNTSFLKDPLAANQWAHQMVDSAKAWDLSTGQDVIVGVIDTGIDFDHPDLKPNIYQNPMEKLNGIDDDQNGYIDDIHGWNFVAGNNQPIADDAPSFHGTHVSGTLGAVGGNGIGIVGHSPHVKILPLKYLGAHGSGQYSDAIRAINYAIQMKVKILSNSWGSTSSSLAMRYTIEKAAKAGILFVAAAGNGDENGRGYDIDQKGFYPAAYATPNIVSVAATNPYDELAIFSNYGSKNVDVAAPGLSIYSTKNGNSYQYMSGTSMATPVVSAVAALIWSLRPDLHYWDVKSILIAGTDLRDTLTGKVVSQGRINAYKALQIAKTYKARAVEPASFEAFAFRCDP